MSPNIFAQTQTRTTVNKPFLQRGIPTFHFIPRLDLILKPLISQHFDFYYYFYGYDLRVLGCASEVNGFDMEGNG